LCPPCRIASWELPEDQVDELELAADVAAELDRELEDRHVEGWVA
jgi:hypothetical protein